MYFQYGQEETEYLSGKDEKLGAVIAQVGRVNREVDTDLFSAVVHHIVGQQISTKAQQTIWRRMREDLGEINAETILAAGTERLQGFGMTFKKVEYIEDCARKAASGELDLEQLPQRSDKEIIDQLVSLKAELSDKVHTENAKCFRNIQDLFKVMGDKVDTVSELEKQVGTTKTFAVISTVLAIINTFGFVAIALYILGFFGSIL